MKLKINKACDLSSISVLPPRRSWGMSSVGDGLGMNQPSQIRSQSQQSFSQGLSLSQLSQSSLEEALITDSRFGSQEKDKSLRISTLAPIASMRDESQLQIASASRNVLPRSWTASSLADSKFQVTEELEHKLRLIESSISRVGMIVDSVQSDVMQVNRAVKELSLDMGGIRQKIGLLENSMQQLPKWEDGIKALIGGSLKSISDQLANNSNPSKINEIATAVTALHEQIGARLEKLEHEVSLSFSIKKVRENGTNSSDIQDSIIVRSPGSRDHLDRKQSLKSNLTIKQITVTPSMSTKPKSPLVKSEEGKPNLVKFKIAEPKHLLSHRHEIHHRQKNENPRIIIDSDDESDVGLSCLMPEKKTVKECDFGKDVHIETLRILRKARKRRRTQNLITVD
ncbi:putative recombination initiation defects 3 [Zingiber officinale]|uniref:Protein PAIR1 n=1 Tax=Zingiber officinale TaxID=94328 RepID=A0A8J5LU45_ZINOF|nr:putative recombination initiation defects 3 [Zingiber officinale]KAG6523486.1 hypothetical protein ZIOFF_013346 [Zingiber officinale]